MTIHIILTLTFSLLLLPGLVFVFLPVLPSAPYMFAITLIFRFLDKSSQISTTQLIILGVIALLSLFIDYLSGLIGAKWGGASKKAMIWGTIGLIAGTFIVPFFGGIIGLLVGVFAAELFRHGDEKKATKAAVSSLLGSVSGMAINFILGLVYIVLFLIFAI